MIVGRDSELGAVEKLVAADEPARALMVSGPPGIGKTTVWEAGIAAAREGGARPLVARPSDAETDLAFAALSDLLDEVGGDELAELPTPQRHALEVALLRAEPASAPPGARAIAAGLLGALRALAARDPLLVAIDDLQWLDAPSAQALAFAARRLTGHRVRFLLAERPGSDAAPALVRALAPLERVALGPLSLGATRALLAQRLAMTPTRRVLRLLCDASGGNPLFAVELGRALQERDLPAIGEELRLPASIEDLFAPRVARLEPPLRTILLAAALSPDIRAAQLAQIAPAGAIDDALAAGLVLAGRDRFRPSHPMLGAAARRHAPPDERQALHRELSRVAADAPRRAHHLALATERPDPEVAATVAAAAAAAAARGAAEEAVALAEHALRLTPHGDPARGERVLALAEYLVVAGEPQRVTALLEPEVDSLPPGAPRVRAHMLLADGGAVRGVEDYEQHLDRALAASEGDPVLRARGLAGKAELRAVARVERIAESEAWALEALEGAQRSGAEAERHPLHALAWTRVLSGRSIDDLLERYRAVADAGDDLYRSVDRAEAVRLAWRGDIAAARRALTALMALADERGQAFSFVVMRLNLCELELRAGEWDVAARLLDEWDQTADAELIVPPSNERCRAMLAAGRGEPEAAERWAAQARAGFDATEVRWELLETQRAEGIAALAGRQAERAIDPLRTVWEHTQREGVGDPGAFPVAPDLVEALTETGELDEAREVTDGLRRLAEQGEHPWGLIGARRCGALVSFAARNDPDGATAALADAASAYERLGLRFDHARSLLSLGRAARRLRRWGAGREALEQAAAAFERIGSPGWAEQARAEAARLGARRRGPAGELTPTERRVAELAASGLTNKEIAAGLFVTVSTVEAHLSHAYAKLGVRSRVQLAQTFKVSGISMDAPPG